MHPFVSQNHRNPGVFRGLQRLPVARRRAGGTSSASIKRELRKRFYFESLSP